MGYGGGGCLTDADSCLLVLVGVASIFFSVGYGVWKIIETFIA